MGDQTMSPRRSSSQGDSTRSSSQGDKHCSFPSAASGVLEQMDGVTCQPCRPAGTGRGNGSFTCAKCVFIYPVSELVVKGSQQWCIKDNKSYNGLVVRWAKNPKLRVWWNGMSAEDQTQWFRKWQSVSAKRRYDDIAFSDASYRAEEDIMDEVDAYIPYWMFRRDELRAGKQDRQIVQEWQELIDSNKKECKFQRGEWLVPRFMGVEKRKRAVSGQSWTASRKAAVENEAQLNSLVQSSGQVLDRWRSQSAAPLSLGSTDAPTVQSMPEDQPQAAKHEDVMIGCISREALGRSGGCPRRKNVRFFVKNN
jgi:hypothetical protein